MWRWKKVPCSAPVEYCFDEPVPDVFGSHVKLPHARGHERGGMYRFIYIHILTGEGERCQINSTISSGAFNIIMESSSAALFCLNRRSRIFFFFSIPDLALKSQPIQTQLTLKVLVLDFSNHIPQPCFATRQNMYFECLLDPSDTQHVFWWEMLSVRKNNLQWNPLRVPLTPYTVSRICVQNDIFKHI